MIRPEHFFSPVLPTGNFNGGFSVVERKAKSRSINYLPSGEVFVTCPENDTPKRNESFRGQLGEILLEAGYHLRHFPEWLVNSSHCGVGSEAFKQKANCHIEKIAKGVITRLTWV